MQAYSCSTLMAPSPRGAVGKVAELPYPFGERNLTTSLLP